MRTLEAETLAVIAALLDVVHEHPDDRAALRDVVRAYPRVMRRAWLALPEAEREAVRHRFLPRAVDLDDE